MVKKLKWNLVLMSALYLGLGVFLLMKPTTALNIVCYALGAVVLACAAVQLIRYFVVERGVFQSQLTLISGIICLALGAFLILRSDIVVSILPIVFGLFVIFDSISRVQNALDLRRCGYSSWKSFLLLPVLSVVLGVIMILNPFGTMETLVMAIGIILIVEGSINLLSALYTVLAVRRFAKLHPETQSMLESLTGQDLNGDGVPSLLVLRTDGEMGPVAEFYGWQGEQMGVSYRCRLSSTMTALNRGSVVTGMVAKDTPAVFITGVDTTNMAVTDILIYRQETGLVNVAMDRNSGVSTAVYPYRQLSPQDIDGDGIIELPCPLGDTPTEQTDGLVSWMRWKTDGRFEQTAKTYHSQSGGWYLTIPTSWWTWDVTAVTGGMINENQMTLHINGDAVLTIYTITGENRDSRSRIGSRIVLRRQTATVYAGEVYEIATYYGMDEDLLRRSFRLILPAWNNS